MPINMFLLRTFDQPLSVADVYARAQSSDWCYDMHKVAWLGSYLAKSGRSLLCCFTAADAESVRLALHESGANTQYLWAGTVHEAPEAPVPNVLVERSFPAPVAFEEIAAAAQAASACLQVRDVKYARTFFSMDRKRMLCFYDAPDAESVRVAQREAKLPSDAVWAFHTVLPKIPR